jgi:hypothetical protein
VLAFGEVRTCLLHNAAPLPRPVLAQLLELVPGQRVRSAERPVSRSVSPELTVGVDCRLAAASQVAARGIGTVTAHAVVTGGLVLQGSTTTRLRRAAVSHRRTWSHYASRPSVVEVISRGDAADLAAGYLADTSPTSALDLGSVSEHVIGVVQMRPQLDHITSLRVRTTRVRWASRFGVQDAPVARVHLENDILRTVELTVREDQLDLVPRFCEDFALHDWLLTTLGHVIEQADRASAGGREPIEVLRPAVERLLHLWMPGAHVSPVMCTLWEALERRPGFSLQWNAQVARIRDQIALETLRALQDTKISGTEW